MINNRKFVYLLGVVGLMAFGSISSFGVELNSLIWMDSFDADVVDTTPPAPQWVLEQTSNIAISESAGELNIKSTDVHSYGNIHTLGTYDDFSCHAKFRFVNMANSGDGSDHNADIRFRIGYSLGFFPAEGMIRLRRADNWTIIDGREQAYTFANDQPYYISIDCNGTAIGIKVGTTLNGSDIVNWSITDSTFASGRFDIGSWYVTEQAWDYFELRDSGDIASTPTPEPTRTPATSVEGFEDYE